MSNLKSMLGSLIDGGAGELGQPDLRRRVVEGILKLRRHADRGVEVLPAEVVVTVTVAEGSASVLERFVQDPAFDRDVEAELANRLVNTPEGALPVRRYTVVPGKRTRIDVVEAAPRSFHLKIDGGDRSGTSIPVPPDRKDLLLGRGPWHGDDHQVANDIVLSETEKAVSRRAARLHRTGAHFELQTVDQREALSVLKPDGHRLRPAFSASGRVPVRPGDVIEFTDGTKPVVTVRLEEV